MRIKGTLEFIIILIIILLMYFVFILNINDITISYHGKVEEYKNRYYKESEEPNVLYEIRALAWKEEENVNEEIPDKGIKIMQNNKIIRNILKKAVHLNEKGIDKYISYLKGEGRINLVNQDIIYIAEENYELAFSLDMNQVIYQKNVSNSRDITWNEKEISIENKYEIYEKVAKEMQSLGITEKFKFEPETIYFSYEIEGEMDSDVYVIEDNKNHIKLTVARPEYEIERLQIGFTESLIKKSILAD